MVQVSDTRELHQRATLEIDNRESVTRQWYQRITSEGGSSDYQHCKTKSRVLGKFLGQFFSQVLIESKIESILVKICSKQWSKSKIFKVSFSPNFQCEVDISRQEKGMCGWKSGLRPLWPLGPTVIFILYTLYFILYTLYFILYTFEVKWKLCIMMLTI